MNIKTTLLSLFLLSALLPLSAQENESDSLRYSYGRKSVKSARSTGTPFADTLDTGNPAVKVLLYSNGTYRYIKDPEAVADDKVFSEYWDTRSTNPYREDISSLPDRFSLWIVDTLDSYCCPNKTTPSSKFGYHGKVRISDYVGGYGNLVVIRHANGLETFYGHMSRRDVQSGDWVSAGDVIGLGGSTGRSTGPHLHFETRYRGAAFDPAWIIDFETGTLRHRLLKIRSWYFNPNTRYVQGVDDEDEIYRSDEEERLAAAEQAKKEAAARAAAERAAVKYYTVRSGDTLSKIAKKNGTTVRNLCRLNGIKETTVLQIGRRLRVR